MLEFLPEKLFLDGEYDTIISRLYALFSADFKDNSVYYKQLPVVYDDRKIDSEYEEGFWHIITRQNEASSDRLLDYKRAKRISWIRPLIEHSDDKRLLKWVANSTDKRGNQVIKTMVWYREEKYLVVLKEIPNKYFLTTAFYVTGEGYERKLLRQYESAKKKGPGC